MSNVTLTYALQYVLLPMISATSDLMSYFDFYRTVLPGNFFFRIAFLLQ